MRSRRLDWLAAPLLLCLPLLAGCSGMSVTFAFGPPDLSLKSVTVAQDAGATSASPVVAQIDLDGIIADRESFALLGPGENPVNELVVRLAQAAGDDDVRAIVLRINSPGGTVAASDLLYEEIRHFRASTEKPVVVSMGEVAASGGYYAALAADEIVAQPATITGSIGVIVPTINVSGGLSRLGIDSRSLTSGPNKDLANPLEPRDPAHEAILQGIVDEFYVTFRNRVIERRPGLDASRIDELTDGRVVTGAQAHRAGLVDHTGDVRVAFERAKSLAGLGPSRLVKLLYDESNRPRSPYSPTASAPTPATKTSNVHINQGIQLNAGATSWSTRELRPMAYYLWLP
ncbi:MAG: signal peptide peptidase SppA [Planctomycetota bacterium]